MNATDSSRALRRGHMTTHMTGEGELDVGVGAFPEGMVAVGDSALPSNLFLWNLGEPMNVFIV